MQCMYIEFWVHAMRLGEGRLLKEVTRDAMKLGSRVKWGKGLRNGFGCIRVARIGHAGIEWTIDE